MTMMRWGMPSTTSRWIPGDQNRQHPIAALAHAQPENRCLVPANSFAKYAREPNPETKEVVWFALNEDRPLFAVASMWTTFNGDRGTKSEPVPGQHQI